MKKITNKNVIIIGGGLAGLSAGYELLAKGNTIKVTIVEALDRVGGRVHTPIIDGVPVDVGGFMVFPFYRELKSLLREFGLEKNLRPINDKEFYRLSEKNWTSDKSISILRIIPLKLFSKLWKIILGGKIRYYEPDLSLFPGVSAYGLLSSAGVKKESIEIYETLMRAYTYPPLNKMPAALLLPIGLKLLFHGMFNRCKVLEGGTSLLVNALSQAIKNKDGEIFTSSTVKEVKKDSIILENGSIMNFDDLIIASQLPIELIKSNKPKEDLPFTHYDFIVAKLSKPVRLCDESKWFIGYQSLNKEEVGFMSFAQMSSYSNLSDEYIGGWLMWPESENPSSIETTESISKDMIAEAFVDNDVVKICHIHRWKLTMPDIDIGTIEEFRKMQGENNIWLAGDYLGFPSMDTAIYTGRKVARSILKKYS
jgi:protoporphyrinogen oxidase